MAIINVMFASMYRMNDFTKEELEDFINWGEVYTEFGCSWAAAVHRPLIDKVQSMIDNYKEDESNE